MLTHAMQLNRLAKHDVVPQLISRQQELLAESSQGLHTCLLQQAMPRGLTASWSEGCTHKRTHQCCIELHRLLALPLTRQHLHTPPDFLLLQSSAAADAASDQLTDPLHHRQHQMHIQPVQPERVCVMRPRAFVGFLTAVVCTTTMISHSLC